MPADKTTMIPEPLPDHPRLLASPDDWNRLRRQGADDAASRAMLGTLRRRASAILGEPPAARRMIGTRLLMTSRQVLERLSVLSLVACVDDNQRFADRAAEEMRAVASFSDWNPSHFLDTAELALAMSIGYDWLHDRLDAATRVAVENALIEKAITPSLDEAAPANWWLGAAENWAQVCHAGLAAAAIAVADRDPATADLILARALERLPPVAADYAPHGAYAEGPMYWSYGTAYHVVLAAALERFTGSTQGVDAYPGFRESADYIRHVTAPSGAYFNYADCAPRRRLQAQLFWLAGRSQDAGLLEYDLAHLDAELADYEAEPGTQYWYYDMVALALLWHRPAATTSSSAASGFWHADGPVPVALYRWSPDFYLGVKGGSAGLSHSHMDLGSFVFEAAGVRWAVDTGMQDYESLESAGVDLWNETEQASPRWDVFRIGPESHNILRFGDAPQLLFRGAGIGEATPSGCVVDLSGVYEGVRDARRAFEIAPRGFSILDTWRADRPVRVASQWLTYADVVVRAGEAWLEQGGRRLRLSAAGSGPVDISVEDVSGRRRPFDLPNPGLHRVQLRVTEADTGWLQTKVSLE